MPVDIIFAILMVLACIKGYQKGLVIAIFSIIAFIIGLAAALKLSTVVAGWLSNSTSISAKWLPILSFLLVFVAVIFLVRLGGKAIERSFQFALLGWVNRLGGILFYAALYIIILSIFIFFAEKMNMLQPSVIASSQTYHFIEPWGPKVIDGFGKLIPIFKDMFTKLEDFFSTLPASIHG